MRILLIRHGDPDYERDALTEKGAREAILLRDRLVKLPIDGFYVSPLGRARDTAAPTLSALGRQAEVCSWLQEFPAREWADDWQRVHAMWDYLPHTRQAHPDWKKENWYDAEPFSGQDTGPLAKFVFEQLDGLLARCGYIRQGDFYRTDERTDRDAVIALFCHFGVGAVLLSHLINVSAPQLLHGLFLAPTSVSLIGTEEVREGLASFRCVTLGDVSHLYRGGEPISFSGYFGSTDTIF